MIGEADVRGLLGSVRCPTVVLHRTNNTFYSIGAGRVMATGITGARFIELDGADHLFWIGNVEPLMTAIEDVGSRGPRRRRRSPPGTVLFVDIVDSTARSAELGDVAWGIVLDTVEDVIGRAVEEHSGRLVKFLGDGALAVFDSPVAAVRAAHRIGDELRALDWPFAAGCSAARSNDAATTSAASPLPSRPEWPAPRPAVRSWLRRWSATSASAPNSPSTPRLPHLKGLERPSPWCPSPVSGLNRRDRVGPMNGYGRPASLACCVLLHQAVTCRRSVVRTATGTTPTIRLSESELRRRVLRTSTPGYRPRRCVTTARPPRRDESASGRHRTSNRSGSPPLADGCRDRAPRADRPHERAHHRAPTSPGLPSPETPATRRTSGVLAATPPPGHRVTVR